MKTNELSQQEQQQTNGGSTGSMPGSWPTKVHGYSPEQGTPPDGETDTLQPSGSDSSVGYDGVGSDHPHYIK